MVISLVLDFSNDMTEVGAEQIKLAAIEFIKQVDPDDYIQVII